MCSYQKSLTHKPLTSVSRKFSTSASPIPSSHCPYKKRPSCLSLTPISLHQSLQEERIFFSISAAVIQKENENNVELPPKLAYAVV